MADMTNNEINVTVDSEIAALRDDVNELTEAVNAIKAELGIDENHEELIEQEKKEDDITPFSSEALDNAVSYGLPFSLFGFSIVFGVLAVIMAVVILFGKVLGASQSKKPAEKKQDVNKQTAAVAEEAPVAPVAVAADDKGIVAAIIAAVSSFRSANGENGGFRVVSFKKRK